MSFLDELGNLLPGQQGGGWQAWLQDPVNRAGLLSFGAQAMTGTGQNFVGEMGTALAKGYEGAAATDTAVRKQREEDEDQQLRASEGAANRSNQMEVAKLNAASREEVARQRQAGMMEGIALRNQGAMDRTQVRQGGAGGSKPMNWNQSVSKAQEDDKAENPMRISNLTPEEADAREARIHSKALRYYQMGREEGATPGAAPPAGAAKPAAPAAKGSPAPQTKGGGGGVTLEQLQKNPKIAPLLATPEGRAKIRAARPDLKHLFPED